MDFTRKKLLNIVAFCALIENNEGIMGKSPDYLIEKFKRYCLSDFEEEYEWGLDSIRKKIVKNWEEKWLGKR